MLNIHAYFDNMSNAGKALKALKDKGYTSAHMDMTGTYDYEYSNELSIGGMGNMADMSAIVVKSGGNLLDLVRKPLIAGGTSISGADHINDSKSICSKLIVSSGDSKKGEIEKIITENEGRIFPTNIE